MAYKPPTRSMLCLGVTLYIFYCLNQSVQATLSQVYEGVGVPMEISEEEANLLQYTKYPGLDETGGDLDFMGRGGHIISEEDLGRIETSETGAGLSPASRGQEEVVYPPGSQDGTEPPPSADSEVPSYIFDHDAVTEEEDEDEEEDDDGEMDDFGFGRVLEAKRTRAGKRLYKNKVIKLLL